jgi:phosphate transport system substrate-binding protein
MTMNGVRRNLSGMMGLALLSAILTAGCKEKADVEQLPDFAKSSAANSIGGAGSTFISPLMANWIESYEKMHPEVQVNYRPIGSGSGIDEYGKRMTEMAASEAPLTDDQIATMFPTVQIPVIAGPVCITYNLPGLKAPLKLSGNTLANIYLGKIVTWQDSAIARDNPGVQLPQAPVIVTHRSDGSGTTFIFTSYLNKVSPDWARRAGQGLTVKWPTGLSAQGTKQMVDLVNETAGTIGYAELTFAKQNNLPVASVQNLGGTYIAPSPASATAAVQAFSDALAKDIRTPIVDPPASAKDAYPISGLSFLLVQKDRSEVDEQKAVKNFISYAISNGQDAAEGLYYAKLPESLQKQGEAALQGLTAGGHAMN